MATRTERVLGLADAAGQEIDLHAVAANKGLWKVVAGRPLKVKPTLLNRVLVANNKPRCQIMIRFSYLLDHLPFHNSNSRYPCSR